METFRFRQWAINIYLSEWLKWEKKKKKDIIPCAGEKAEQLELSSLDVEKAKQPCNFEKHFEQIEEFDSFL